MALSLSSFLASSVLLLTTLVAAETHTYDFNIGWVSRNPDGQKDRPVIGINGEWPIPKIDVNIGDRLVVNVKNDLGNQSTSLHWHGLFQNGTNHMDGVAQGTQCQIAPGASFTYNFTVDQPGTYWYHSHVGGQYPDGLRGPLIVHDPENPYADLFDEELVLTLSDWYHDQMPPLIAKFLSVTNPTGAEPVPQSALMNDTQGLQIPVQPGKTYFIRIINMAAFAAQNFWIDGHTFRIIEVDGVYTEPTEASLIYITAAQRYGILLTTKNETDANFAIMGSMDEDLFDVVPDGLNANVTSYLVYDASLPMPDPPELAEFEPFDDMELVPTDGEELYTDPSLIVQLDVAMDNLGDGANYAFFSGVTYVAPKVPTLYTALSAGEFAANASVYGTNTNSFVLEHNTVVEIVLNNQDPGKHPFHLHGHNFQTILRGEEESGDFDPESVANGSVVYPTTPMRRDVILVRPNGHLVMRFRADNPGVWVFHCHIEWHVDSGLIMTFVEAPLVLQETLTIPAGHFDACAAVSPPIPTVGNAAANSKDYLDLSGQNLPHAPLPSGFTPRGIVALTFSIVAGLLGVAVIAWYGMGEMSQLEKNKQVSNVQHIAADRGVISRTNTDTATGAGPTAGADRSGAGDAISEARAN